MTDEQAVKWLKREWYVVTQNGVPGEVFFCPPVTQAIARLVYPGCEVRAMKEAA